jgi:uncharacterized membrane protein
MSQSYAWVLFLHIVAALWLAAGVFGSTVVRAQGKRAAGVAERAMALGLLWRLHAVFTLPGVVVAGLVGFYLVTAGGFRFNELWVMAASGIYLLLFLSTHFVITPALSRQRTVAAQATVATAAMPELDRVAGQKLPGILSDVNALLLLLLVLLMVVKP